jgi:hypothetical protein
VQPLPLPAELPGRVLLLARLPPASGAPTSGDQLHSTNGEPAENAQNKGQAAVTGSEAWKAFWLTGAELAGGGVRMSRHVVSDHWPSRLLGALGQLSGAAVADDQDNAAKQV